MYTCFSFRTHRCRRFFHPLSTDLIMSFDLCNYRYHTTTCLSASNLCAAVGGSIWFRVISTL